MNIELTDATRYDLEKENIINVLLAVARRGDKINEEGLAQAVGIDTATTEKLITKLKTDLIIK